ncbi:hypothetical protein MROS_2523 [Melioribacter roseus P3M-2]|uniref:Uncharacterized protein n=1 Tax=Melioribacter roseus (strain DSM 23840 / JCM 17771 / VKM B-2668 / P3M-2) TaxID=1191523 RepID=I7A3F3_MELRP|nr:hypothetical protein [Melioribacter roseus]AFN75753.1 hypothetical protein MROS_2523 [Melioribacter roseus P3M-2]
MTTSDYYKFKEALGFSESGGNYNKDYGNYWGKYQFGEARRKDIESILGLKHLTRSEFTPEMQEKFFEAHVKDLENKIISSGLDKYIGSKVAGKSNNLTTRINLFGLIAGAHLGGFNGLKKAIETNFVYDPADSFGTHISDYIAKFSWLMEKKITDFWRLRQLLYSFWG